MNTNVEVIADSVSPDGHRVITLTLRYWRSIHAEFMTHKAPSRNASSSRAIPVAKMLAQVLGAPAGPIHWGSNQKGMQARDELTGLRLGAAKLLWRSAALSAAIHSWSMMKIGLHKQVANRVTEPYQYITVVATAMESAWMAILALRDHPDAQPEFRELAHMIDCAMSWSTPTPKAYGEWHLPFDLDDETWAGNGTLMVRLEHSSACCARVSYNNHDGTATTVDGDRLRHDQLKDADPPHMSPFEHQLRCMPMLYNDDKNHYANYYGWRAYRHFLERGDPPK